MTIKIAHVADTHLGYRQYGLAEREEDIYITFNKIIDDMIDKKVDYVLHAGDLFENPKPPIKALLVAQECFNKLLEHDIPVYVIAGNHDTVQRRKTAIPQKLYENKNFHIVNYSNRDIVLEEDLFLTGLQYFNKSKEDLITKRLKESIEKAKEYKWKILMLHGSISKYFEIEPEFELKTIPEGYDYYAMGHLHNRINDSFKGGKLSYPGSTEIRSKSELQDYYKNKKGYNLITITDDNLNIEYINIPLERDFIDERIDYSKLNEKLEELEEKIKDNLHKKGKKPVVYLSIENGNYDRSDVATTIYDKLEDITLTTRITYKPTEVIENIPENLDKDNITPENMIKERLKEDYGDEIVTLAIELYKNLSEKNIQTAQNIADDFYKKTYQDIKGE